MICVFFVEETCKYDLDTITFDEFSQIASKISKDADVEKCIQQSFNALDTESKGYVSGMYNVVWLYTGIICIIFDLIFDK